MTDLPIEGELVPIVQGQRVASASNVGTSGSSDVQTRLDEVNQRAARGPAWNFDSATTEDPPTNGFRFNNADPELATIIYLDAFSAFGRFDEFLTQFSTGGFIFVQDTTNALNNYLFRTTGQITQSGGGSGWFVVPVDMLRAQGTFDSVNDDRWHFEFLTASSFTQRASDPGTFILRDRTIDATSPATFADSLSGITPALSDAYRIATGGEPFAGETINAAAGDILWAVAATPSLTSVSDWVLIKSATSAGLTLTEAAFLQQITESDVNVNQNNVGTSGEATFVRFWLRQNQVDQADINAPGIGLLIAEAQEDTFTQSNNEFDAILYVGVPDTYSPADFSTLRVRVTTPDGRLEQDLSLENDFVEAAELSVAGTTYYRSTNAARGVFLGYKADDVIGLFRIVSERRFTVTPAPIVNLKDGIADLPESALTQDVQGKLNADGVPQEIETLFDQFVPTPPDQTPGTLPTGTQMLFKFGGASATLAHYTTTDVDTGIFGTFDGVSTQIVAIDDQFEITNFNGIETGVGTIVEITPSILRGKRMYRVTLPQESSGTNFYIPSGFDVTPEQYNATERIKIGSDNFDTPLAEDFRRLHDGELNGPLTDLNQHLQFTPVVGSWGPAPNPTPARATITRQFAAYWNENRRGSTPFTGNFFTDLADPTITLTNGVNVSGLPLTNTSTKVIAFSHYIANENFTTEVPLLKAGTRRILSLTSRGLAVRRGNSDGSVAPLTINQRLSGPAGQGTTQYLTGVGADSVPFFVPDTLTFPDTFTIQLKTIEADGEVGPVTDLLYTVINRGISQNQSSQIVAMNLPTPPGGTRDETITTEYDSTNNTIIVGTTGQSQNTSQDVTHISVEVFYPDISQSDNLSITASNALFGEQDEHRGRTIDIVMILEDTHLDDEGADKFLRVKAVINGHQENDIDLNFRQTDFDFSDLQFGPNTAYTDYFFSDGDNPANVLFPGKQSFSSDGDVSIANIQVYEFDFGSALSNTPTHDELYQFYLRRDQWFGLFSSPDTDYGNYTFVDRGLILTDDDGTTFDVIERLKLAASARTVQESQVFAAAASVTVSLPAGTTLEDFILMEIEWNTGQTDASASDNDNRRYSDTTMVQPIIDASGPNVILSARGRGAENFGVRITAGQTSDTTVAIEIVNINDVGGAVLPTGTQITKVWFY